MAQLIKQRPAAPSPELGEPAADRPALWFWIAVGAIAGVGIALRVLTMIGYVPANLSYSDTASYVHAAGASALSNPFRPAGYAVFLRELHALSGDLRFTVLIQHALGLATAVGVYLVCRLVGARRAVALVPAAVVALSGDQLYIEHVLLSDDLFIALTVLACYLVLKFADAPRPASRQTVALLLGASATVAVLGLVRTVGVALVPVFLVWLLVTTRPSWRRRLVVTGIGAAVCLVLLLSYAIAQQRATGVFGLSRFSGWPLYARVAPFAQCRDFTPPAGTGSLCERSAVSTRSGPDYYLWDGHSPAQRTLGGPPAHGRAVGRFALAAIEHQPLSYIYVVARDLARYVDPGLVTRPGWGGDWRSLALDERWPSGEAINLPTVRAYWSHTSIHVREPLMHFLEGWRQVFRIHGALIAICALLTLVGISVAREPRIRRSLVLVAAFSFTLFLIPVATDGYQARYALPAAVLLLIAAARGAELVVERIPPAERIPWRAGR